MKSSKSTNLNSFYRANNYKFSLQVFLILLLASFVASIAAIPYSSALLYQDTLAPPKYLMFKVVLFEFIVLTVPLLTIGLWLGSSVRLGTPHLRAMSLKVSGSFRRFQSSIFPSIVLGILCGIFICIINILFSSFLPPELEEIKLPGFFPALLASFSAAVIEEIWFRLGIMNCLLFLGSKLMRQSKPHKTLVWSANFIAALGFAAMHLPLAVTLVERLTPFFLVDILGLNSVAGLVFGYLYWRYGLLAAMIAHFSTGLVIRVIPALFSAGMT